MLATSVAVVRKMLGVFSADWKTSGKKAAGGVA